MWTNILTIALNNYNPEIELTKFSKCSHEEDSSTIAPASTSYLAPFKHIYGENWLLISKDEELLTIA